MRNGTKLIAIITAAALLLANSTVANASPNDDRSSKTSRIVKSIAVGALVGLAAYALSRDDGRNYRSHRRHNYYGPRSYVAFGFGFSNYSVGSPYGRYNSHNSRGYWFSGGGQRFYRIPYRYNHRYDRSFNSGWERGYWVGYLQGQRDAGYGARYYDRFSYNNRYSWGYNSRYGSYSNYERGFSSSYRTGYQHGYRRQGYGHDNFGHGRNSRY